MSDTPPDRCHCGRRLLVTGSGELCVRCMKTPLPPRACTCRRLETRTDGWGEVAFFPRSTYRIEEEEKGWSILTRDDGSFT